MYFSFYLIFPLFVVLLIAKSTDMNATEILTSNIDLLCQERKWKRKDLAEAMGVQAESLSRSLNGSPRLDTIEKIAKALDVSIKSLFENPDAIEGFVSVQGVVHRINSREEFDKLVGKRTGVKIKPVKLSH